MSSAPADEPGPLKYLDNGLLDVTPTGHYVAITDRNAQVSPLLRLPAELRDYIWRYVLKDNIIRPFHIETTARIHNSHGYNNNTSLRSRFHNFRRPSEHRFSLLHVSRQVYDETASLPYTLSTFAFLDSCSAFNWMVMTPPHALKLVALVRHVRFPSSKSTSLLLSHFQKGSCSLEKIDVQLMYSTLYDDNFTIDKKIMDWATAHKIELTMTSCTWKEVTSSWLAGS